LNFTPEDIGRRDVRAGLEAATKKKKKKRRESIQMKIHILIESPAQKD
jgi:hypothetical protein